MTDPISALARTALPQKQAQSDKTDPALWKVAKEFEAVFLNEMLKHSGLNKTSDTFGGGAGEEAFGSMLTSQYAKQLSSVGGIGIAQHIYAGLINKGKTDDQ